MTPALLSSQPQAEPSSPTSVVSAETWPAAHSLSWALSCGGPGSLLTHQQSPEGGEGSIRRVPGGGSPCFSTAPGLGGKLTQSHQAPALDFLFIQQFPAEWASSLPPPTWSCGPGWRGKPGTQQVLLEQSLNEGVLHLSIAPPQTVSDAQQALDEQMNEGKRGQTLGT